MQPLEEPAPHKQVLRGEAGSVNGALINALLIVLSCNWEINPETFFKFSHVAATLNKWDSLGAKDKTSSCPTGGSNLLGRLLHLWMKSETEILDEI